mmetsp:Transcript_6913/g.17346  ORF Transcript_6913/g.17346 Transcript_6913/m.17346 type:complete len:468 (-) Transcript_6913:344-1747(-)
MKRKANFITAAPVFSSAAVAYLLMASGTSAFSPVRSTNARMRSIHTSTNSRYGTMSMISTPPSPAATMMMMSKIDLTEQDSDEIGPESEIVSKSETQPKADSLQKNENENDKDNTTTLKKRGTQVVAAALAMALAFLPVSEADARSGGRMGGSFHSSYSSRPSISRSSRTTRTYISPRPSVTIAPSVGFGYGTPYFSPFGSPFMGPRYFGGAGVMTVTRGPSFFDLLFFGGLTFAVASIFLREKDNDTWTAEYGSPWESSTDVFRGALGPGTSVVQLSVALEVPDRDDRNSILSVLDRLSETARTDNRVGIQNLSSQVALEILRRRSSIVSANSSTKHFGSRDKALREFQSRSVSERSKFESETVNKYGGVDYSSPPLPSENNSGSGSGDRATMAVITLVLAIDGDSTKLNRINGISDVEQALQKIASDSKVSDCLQSAEILWTPVDRMETLGIRDVAADYPELRSV